MFYHRPRKPNIFKRIFTSKYSLSLLGLALLILISIPLARNINKQYQANDEIVELNEEIVKLEGKNDELKNLIEFLESDQFVEGQARINLNLKKEGEKVLVIKDRDGQALEGASRQSSDLPYSINEATVAEDSDGNIRRWWNYFFKI